MSTQLQTYEATKLSRFVNAVSFRVVGSSELPDYTATNNDMTQYAIGVGTICLSIFIFFFFWAFILLVAKCCTCKPPCNNVKGLRNVNDVWRVTKRLQMMRVIFFFSSLVSLASVVLFVIQGSFGFLDAKNAYIDDSNSLEDFLLSMSRAFIDFSKSADALLQSANEVFDQVTACNSAFASLNVTYAADTTDLSASIAEIASGQAEVSNIGVSGTLFDELAQGLVDDIQWMENRVETYSTWYAWVSFGVSTFIGLLILPFIFGVLLAIQGSVKPGLVKCFSTFNLTLLNIMACLFALLNIIYGVVSVASSDFCVDDNGPDNNLIDFAAPGDWRDTFLMYYLKCAQEPYFAPTLSSINTYLDLALVGMNVAGLEFNSTYFMTRGNFTGSSLQYLDAFCIPVGSYTSDLVGNEIPLVVDSISSVSDVLSCSTVTPLYQSMAYDTTCKGFADAFVWMWITSTTMILGVLLMNTFRRAYDDDMMASPELFDSSGYSKDDDETASDTSLEGGEMAHPVKHALSEDEVLKTRPSGINVEVQTAYGDFSRKSTGDGGSISSAKKMGQRGLMPSRSQSGGH